MLVLERGNHRTLQQVVLGSLIVVSGAEQMLRTQSLPPLPLVLRVPSPSLPVPEPQCLTRDQEKPRFCIALARQRRVGRSDRHQHKPVSGVVLRTPDCITLSPHETGYANEFWEGRG